ncbi:MAG: hypothetical protein Q615_SPAC00129G0021 [Streptococcus anginosus DORA_7]|uniref:Uncharacterized protein n=1 Tax=Streptococcus anginosus DORA_7 TaxID=1403946 RepID=W1TRQ3_STRAP|nr:MAG: hypothetical protein Q615_SPAC00129G0021 [Streptococcus anginosus DORA_7]
MAPDSQPTVKVAPFTTEPGTKLFIIVPRESVVSSPVLVSCFRPAMAKIAPVLGFIATAYTPSEYVAFPLANSALKYFLKMSSTPF